MMDYTTKYVIYYHCLQKYTLLSIEADTEDKRKWAREHRDEFERLIWLLENQN